MGLKTRHYDWLVYGDDTVRYDLVPYLEEFDNIALVNHTPVSTECYLEVNKQ